MPPTLEQYQEASYRDAIEISKLQTALKIAADRVASAYEDAALIIEQAQIFHCWGDKEIDGLAVQKRLAAEIRSRPKETQ